MLPKCVSFLPILTVLGTLTPQEFFTGVQGQMLGSGRQHCCSGQCSCQRGWANFDLLKKKDGGRQSPDFPAQFDHPHHQLGQSSWAVSVTIKQTRPQALSWDGPACITTGVLPTGPWLLSTHLLPGSAKCFLQDGQGPTLLPLSRGDKGTLSGERRECLCVDVSCGSHLLLKQRQDSSPYAERWSFLKMYHSLVVRGLSLPWGPGSSTHGPFRQVLYFF